jgi:signal transduction histidine kinase/ligand-binding sensor domain-containing protein
VICARPTKVFPTFCLLYAVLLAANQAIAEYRFDVWTAESGLPLNTVRAILQSRDGYLWVGTLDGLARFDGVRFTVFNKGTTPGLPANRVLGLYEDPQNDLWIALGENGLARYHAGQFTLFGQKEGLPSAGSIAGDQHGNLWVSTVDDASFHWKEGRFEPALPNKAGFAREAIRGHRPGIVWVTNQYGMQIFSRGTLTTLSASNGLPRAPIHQVDDDQNGNWWLATEAGLVKVRDGKVLRIYTQQDGLPHNSVNANPGPVSPAIACEDSKGNLWINGAGPWLGRLKDGVFTAYPSTNTVSSHPLPLAPGLADSAISALFEDREGNLWIGTEGRGLIRAREQVVNALSIREGLRAANVYPVLQDRAGAVWLGTWELGLARIKAGSVTNFPLEFPHKLVTALCEDRQSRLWVGTFGGVVIFEKDQINLAGIPLALTNQVVNAICEDHNGVLWFGGERGLFRDQNGRVSVFTERDGLPRGFIVSIIEDRAGALWIGTRAGLTRLANGRFTTWTERDGLPSNKVPALYEDGEGTLWIGTSDGGLGRFKDGRFTRYTTREGMFDNGVFQILEDARGNFWMSSNRGIHRVSKRELNEFAEGRRRSITSIAYSKSDGMLNPECNGGCWPTGVKTRDGKLWFPTQDGVAVIDPAALATNPRPPPVVIEAFLLDREPQALDSPLRVPPGKANIEIQYTGLSFVNSERLSFKYRMAGVDNDWVEAGTRRTAYFSHLSPGHYVFTVLAANSDGVWNETGKSLAFDVLPAWYETWWFRGVAGAGLAGLLFGAYARRVARLERARLAEKEFSRRLMESQEQERQRLAAELHDSVGQNLLVIKNRAQMALDKAADPQKMTQQITEVSNMASLALREVRGMAQDLRPFQLDELGLAKAITAMVRRLAESSNIQFRTEIVDLNGELSKEREIHFYRIIQELLTNVVKHSKATEANLAITKSETVLLALLRDNGCGFDVTPTANYSASGAGFGLRGIRERMRTLGGRFLLDSRAGAGTTVTLEVPTEKPRSSADEAAD